MAAVETSEQQLYEELKDKTPAELFRWALDTHGHRAGIITSFQDTGCVMIDIMSKAAPGMRVITVDTLRLPEETYDLMRRIEQRYGLEIERFSADPERLARMVRQHGEFLFFDSKDKQEYCCKIRKVEPNDRALETLDVWFTGVRRDQSEFRMDTPRLQLVNRGGRKILKISPLADWDKGMIDAYAEEHDVPMNALYGMGYTSIGCVICTTPTLPHENVRAGRWRWFNYLDKDDKECGIHVGGSGI
jgi:phosphoadenosine phosphosulfate reductase